MRHDRSAQCRLSSIARRSQPRLGYVDLDENRPISYTAGLRISGAVACRAEPISRQVLFRLSYAYPVLLYPTVGRTEAP